MAQALISRRYFERGITTRVVVLPLPESGLPLALVEAGEPVSLDLLAGRPINLELDEEGLSADLCFAGPPLRCHFPWEAIVAVQDASNDLVQTLVVTVATVMEDSSLRPTQAELRPKDPPAIELLEGEGRSTPRSRTARRRPLLQVIEGDQGKTRSRDEETS